MDIQEIIFDSIYKIAEDEAIAIGEISMDTALVDDIKLKSLQLARLFAMLEMEHGLDLFSSGQVSVTDIRTIGDLYNTCEAALTR